MLKPLTKYFTFHKCIYIITKADYCEGRELDRIVKTIIDKIVIENKLDDIHKEHKTNSI